MEGRRLLTAVTIDQSNDPSADTIDVSASGANTIVSVNGNVVRSVTSSTISSLTITGTNYNDTISFNYDGGNPVPNGTISVNGYGGTNELTATGNTNFSVANYVKLYGNISSFINFSNIQEVVVVAGSSSDLANLGAGNSGAGVFNGHLAVGSGTGPGANYQANDGSFNNIAIGFGVVNAFSSNASDVANLDDYYAGVNNAVGNPTASWFGSSTLEDVANTFATVHFSAGDTQDRAYLDDTNNSSTATATYTPLNATFSGSGYSYTASSFPFISMTGHNQSDYVSLSDTGTQGTFDSYSTYSSVAGILNSENYNGTAYFSTVYANAAQITDISNWYDTAGGANVALNSYGQPYILFSNGAHVTDIGFGRAYYPTVITANNQTNPAKLDYGTASSASLVGFQPNSESYWYLDANK